MSSYRKLLGNILKQLPAAVETHSLIVMEEIKRKLAFGCDNDLTVVQALRYMLCDRWKKRLPNRSLSMLSRLRVLEIRVLETLATSDWRVVGDAHAQRRGG